MPLSSVTKVFGSILAGAGAASAAAALSATTACGDNSQSGQAARLAVGVLSDMGNSSLHKLQNSSEEIEETVSSSVGILKIKFEDYKKYVPKFEVILKLYHLENPEYNILPSASDNEFKAPIKVDVFWAFGAPSHSKVHVSVMFAYESSIPGQYICLKTDLQNDKGDIDIQCSKNVILQDIGITNGVKKLWKFKGTTETTLKRLMEKVETNIIEFPSEYGLFRGNCIRFANSLIESFNYASNLERVTKTISNDEHFKEFTLTKPSFWD